MDGKVFAVVGGGIAGLSAAWRLAQAGDAVVLIEAQRRLGGKVATIRQDGFVVELGPDSFLARKPELRQLAEALGLADRFLPTEKTSGIGSYVYSRGRLRRLPEGLAFMVPARLPSFLATDLLSWPGKLRALADLVLPARHHGPDGDETLTSLVGRRLGREVLERLAEPLVAGIHAADPDTMSLRASFPRLLEMEDRHGSLIRAAMAARRSPPTVSSGSHFLSFVDGMASVVEALEAKLAQAGVTLARGEAVVALAAEPRGRLRLRLEGGDTMVADGVVLAVPATQAARLLAELAPEAAATLRTFRALSVGIYAAAYRKTDLPSPLLGHGFVVPAVEGRRLQGVTYLSEKWRGRTPSPDFALIRAFVGGARQQGLLEGGEEAVRAAAREELGVLLGIRGDPVAEWVHLWRPGLPQYTLGHLTRLASAEQALAARAPAVRLAGASYHGIGLPDCVASGWRAADGLRAALAPRPSPAAGGSPP